MGGEILLGNVSVAELFVRKAAAWQIQVLKKHNSTIKLILRMAQ